MQLVSLFSLGRIVDAIARAVGWSPAGRELVLRDAEGPDASLFEGSIGTVVSIDGESLALACKRNSGISANESRVIRLTPRHLGWTGYSLMLCNVAVVATVRAADGRDAQTIAIASMSRRGRDRSAAP